MTLIAQRMHRRASKLLVLSCISCLLLMTMISHSEALTRVTHVRFRWEGSKVHIYYDLEGEGISLVTLVASEDGGQTFPITPRTVSGDIGGWREPGRDKHIVWEALKDVKELRRDGLVFDVTAWTVSRPELALGDTTLSFGEAMVGEEHTQILEICNQGKVALRVWDIRVEGEKFQLVSEAKLEVPPGEKGKVRVKFSLSGEYEGKLVFQTNDEQYAMGEVLLRGIVLTDQETVPRAELVLAGDRTYDFGEVLVGEESTQSLKIENQGKGVLRVEDAVVSEGFSVWREEWTVPPDQEKDIEITFAPSREGPYEGTLILQTNDKARYPEGVTLKLMGSGKPSVVEPSEEFSQISEKEGKPKLEVLLRGWGRKVLKKGETIGIGPPLVGHTTRKVIWVRNVGKGTLVADLFVNETGEFRRDAYWVDPRAVRVPEGKECPVEVWWYAREGTETSAQLWVHSEEESWYVLVKGIGTTGKGSLVDAFKDRNVRAIFVGLSALTAIVWWGTRF